MQLIVISPAELAELIRQNVREVLTEQDRPGASATKPLNMEEAANYLGIPKNTLYQLTATRSIPHQKLGKRVSFLTAELDDWVMSKRKKTRTEIENEASTPKRKGAKK